MRELLRNLPRLESLFSRVSGEVGDDGVEEEEDGNQSVNYGKRKENVAERRKFEMILTRKLSIKC